MVSHIAERTKNIEDFVSGHFQGKNEPMEPMLGDAGLRSYSRVVSDGNSYIVMDCPPEYCSVQPFIDIAHYLRENDFSAPEIIAQDIEQGFLILEDFGTLSVKEYLMRAKGLAPQERKRIYHLIIDLLTLLQQQEPPDALKEFNDELLSSELDIFVDWYIPYAYKKELKIHEFDEFIQLWKIALEAKEPMAEVIVLRDYHVENMMYLENREGINQLGLLDFQDALFGSPIYDLVSVLEDARFDIPKEEALEYIKYFVEKKELDIEDTLLNYHILGAQRNSRILGVFARKAERDGDDSYLQYIPRVLKYLEQDLSHPILAPIKNWLKKL